MLARSRAFLHKRFRFRHLFLLSHLFENRSSVVLFSVLTLSLSLSLLSISIYVSVSCCAARKEFPGTTVWLHRFMTVRGRRPARRMQGASRIHLVT